MDIPQTYPGAERVIIKAVGSEILVRVFLRQNHGN